MKGFLTYAGSIALCLLAGAIGGVATVGGTRDWYPSLAKPEWNPPAWVFGPVWTVLYILMGIALARVLSCESPARISAIKWFLAQLALNAAWSFLFFGLRLPVLALVDIVLLLGVIVITVGQFLKVDRPAGMILVPYLCWVAFATVLNASIWWLNR